ncbi:MAG: malectin domain-containing carbohydrate-binding protein, partial [Bacteroidota bacterium]
NYLDKKVINDYKSGKGGIVDCVKGCRNNDGGLPKLARNQLRLNIPSNPSGDHDGDGYTNLEEWLHQMAAEVEGKPYDPGEEPENPNPGLGDTFSWYKLTDADKQDQVVSINLTEGKNTLEVARNEAGILLDKIYLSKNSDVPSGIGEEAKNCEDDSGQGLSSIRLNAGGVAFDASGKLFKADSYYTAPSSTGVYNSSIHGTPYEGLYQTERKGSSFGYNIPLENGEYDIRLRFAELRWLESGKRRFDISMEGNRMIKDFDIFAESNFGFAVDKEFLGVQVQDGILDIDLTATLGEAQICAIEILPAGSLSNSTNTPPSFTTSGDLILVQDFEGVEFVEVNPAAVPASEASQEVTYELSPAFSLISNISINSSTGLVEVKALEGIAGSEEFTIIANDGQDKNNVYTQTFKLVILSDEPNTIKGGGSIVRINAGGPAYTSEGGNQFIADKFFQGNSGEYTLSNEIEGTNDDPLYQSERWGYEFGYQIPVINGEYEIILHFAEVYWSDAGKRLFDVRLEGESYFSDYDIYQRYGKNAVAIERLEGIIVTDGVLNLDFFSKKHMAKISAIEVISSYSPGAGSGKSVRINCGENKTKAFGGQVFQSDIGYVSSNTRSLLNENIGIAATNYDEIYQTARSSQVDGEGFGYKIPVENGKYVVYLHFAEIYWGVPGGATGGKGNRIFSIMLEDEVIEETYDILSKTEVANAYVERIEIEVTDGLLDLDLEASYGRPLLSAIEVLAPADEETSIGNSIYLDQIGVKLETGIFKDVRLFPNPAVSTPKMSINSEIDGDFEMNIIDMQGRVLKRQLLRKSGQIAKYVLPTDDLPTGMYIIRLFTTLENSLSLKLIKPE